MTIHKSGTKREPDSCRPISRFTFFKKTFEKLLHKNIIDFFDSHLNFLEKMFW